MNEASWRGTTSFVHKFVATKLPSTPIMLLLNEMFSVLNRNESCCTLLPRLNRRTAMAPFANALTHISVHLQSTRQSSSQQLSLQWWVSIWIEKRSASAKYLIVDDLLRGLETSKVFRFFARFLRKKWKCRLFCDIISVQTPSYWSRIM